MNMDDPGAVPAGQVPGAALATTVTIELRGLKPGTAFLSHVHDGSCENGGGAHYKFDPAGGDLPSNEIHLAFTSTAQGTGAMTVQNDRRAGPNARSVVVHSRDLIDNRVACAPLR